MSPRRRRDDDYEDDRYYDDDYDDPPRRRRRGFECPYCGYRGPIIQKKKVSPAGWAVFVLLLLTLFGIIICWLGLLIREDYRACPDCGCTLG